MLPLFGDERKRKINLGGTSTASSHRTILEQARAQRDERSAQKRREASAVRIQAWWRGMQQTGNVRQGMRQEFESDVKGLVGLRCLVLMGPRDEEALLIWSREMVRGGPSTLFELARHTETRESWLVLIRQVASLLLRSVSKNSTSTNAVAHLQILNTLLSTVETERVLGANAVSMSIASYLLSRDLYTRISYGIRSIPVTNRSSPSLPLLVTLSTSPFSLFPPKSPQHAGSLTDLLTHILSIPLLPNRLPAPSLAHLSSKVPFLHLPTIAVSTLAPEARPHLLATLHVFVTPRYKLLPPNALGAYLTLITNLLNGTPAQTLNPAPPKSSKSLNSVYDSDSDADSSSIRVSIVSSFTPLPVVQKLDAKTLKRLNTLYSAQHIAALLTLPNTLLPKVVPLVFALESVWPAVSGTVLAHPAGAALVRQIYRGWVRGGRLGREGDTLGLNSTNVLGVGGSQPKEEAWVMLLCLTDLYTKALVTMGDDEFFGSGTGSASMSSSGRTLAEASGASSGTGPSSAARNPMTLDELTSFSRQLLNIAFALYWREGVSSMGAVGGGTSDPGLRCTWEDVREKVTRCLVGIHARDSRKPFVPADHWLVSSQIDMQSFVEAAIFEERQLSSPSSTPLPTQPGTRQSASHTHTKRQLAYLSPRLGVLNNIPFAIPFSVRVSIFRNFVLNDMMARAASSGSNHPVFAGSGWMGGNGRTRVQVRRGSVAQDGFDRLGDADLKAPIEIAFIDQFGAEEAGIDGGGVFKEFFTSLCKEVFDTDRGLWLANKKNELYPNPHAYATEGHSLNWYRFIGRILGKAMYEGILVDVAFAGFFLAKWLGKQSFLDDLASLDPDLYNGLIFLKHYNGNFEDLALNFTVSLDEFDVTKTIDLIPDGSNIAVTRENRLQYIYLVSHYKLTKQIKLQSEAFFEGLSEMIDPKWIRMFNQQEIQILLGGVNTPINWADLRTNTNYGGLYDDKEDTITAFWNVVETFDQEQRMALLRFVTSCSRPPLLGFKELVPNFSIRDAGSDQTRLPTSSTCVNLLKLPRYKSETVLRAKLLQAITSNAGFDLS
ncbi:hypothetical protein BDZ94DRAFT_1274548 [Collybia nuda]|uniref:HECT-type E3 ubiquitin transferase n=1 Tax=Collybia nuda TaxID=64659 RepID=A0A9P5XWB1_9AGAR|nr:hypothetical protein BDZ94DRAFT_1274548 [Collybia nuda]